MTTRIAPRGLRVLVYVGWAKPVRIVGQGHPHAKPALKCEMRDVAVCCPGIGGTLLSCPWHLLGSPAE